MQRILYKHEQGIEGLEFEDFRARFIEICKDHRESRRAVAFAFILADLRHAEIRKVLKDEDYWAGLDELSGKHLTVFSFHLPQRHDDLERKRRNDFLRQAFGDVEIEGPLILFFQVDHERVISQCAVQVKPKNVEDAFAELRKALESVVEAIRQVLPKNINNHAEIFNLVHGALLSFKVVRIVKAASGIVGPVKGVVDFVGALAK